MRTIYTLLQERLSDGSVAVLPQHLTKVFRRNLIFSLDIAFLFSMLIVAISVSFLTSAPYILSTALFFGIPSLYLSIRSKSAVKNTAIFTAILAIPFTIVINHICIISDAWRMNTLLPLNGAPTLMSIDDFLWGFLYVYSIYIFYIHFFRNGKPPVMDKNTVLFSLCMLPMLAIFFIIDFINPELFQISYSYVVFGISMCVIPLLITSFRYPHLLVSFTKTALFFLVLTLVYELTALELNQWFFPGTDYIGWVYLLGHRFPLDELIFYMILGAPALLSFYTLFADKKMRKPA